jgi:outer membrane biosynthesis protein TonB
MALNTEGYSESNFSGSPGSWSNYLLKNLRYPTVAAANKIQGKVGGIYIG